MRTASHERHRLYGERSIVIVGNRTTAAKPSRWMALIWLLCRATRRDLGMAAGALLCLALLGGIHSLLLEWLGVQPEGLVISLITSLAGLTLLGATAFLLSRDDVDQFRLQAVPGHGVRASLFAVAWSCVLVAVLYAWAHALWAAAALDGELITANTLFIAFTFGWLARFWLPRLTDEHRPRITVGAGVLAGAFLGAILT